MPRQVDLESEKFMHSRQQPAVTSQPARSARGATLVAAAIRFTFWCVLFGSTCFLVIRGVAAANNPRSYSIRAGEEVLNWRLFCANLLRFDAEVQADDGTQRKVRSQDRTLQGRVRNVGFEAGRTTRP